MRDCIAANEGYLTPGYFKLLEDLPISETLMHLQVCGEFHSDRSKTQSGAPKDLLDTEFDQVEINGT
ncbi:MAG: hypothetical protein ACFE0I_02550 [Elainellaceae cyanobacterium]